MIDDPEVDVVYNPLANSLHAPWNLAAIAAGKPVLSEKPFARDESEARRVAEAADAAGVTVLEGFHYFFHPVTQRAFELAGDGTIGEVTRVEVRMAMPAPGDDDPRWSLDLAGGALMDLGCYGLHVMRSLGRLAVPGIDGPPSIVRAHAEQRTPGVDAWCDVELGFPGGATGLSANSMVAEDHSFTIRIVGHGGRPAGARLHQAQHRRPADAHAPRRAPPSNTSAPGRRTPISWRRSPPTSSTAPRCRSARPTRWRTWRSSTRRTARRRFPGSPLRTPAPPAARQSCDVRSHLHHRRGALP